MNEEFESMVKHMNKMSLTELEDYIKAITAAEYLFIAGGILSFFLMLVIPSPIIIILAIFSVYTLGNMSVAIDEVKLYANTLLENKRTTDK